VKERRGGRLKVSDKALFEGAFWTARDALDRGVIDGTADYVSCMTEKFGDKTKFVDCSPEKTKFPFSLLGAQLGEASLAEDAIAAIETRAAWSRFGL
jgi:ClpP class serine protease